jgi:restriction endonuclease S subunit
MFPSARVGDLAEQVRGVTYGKDDASRTPAPGYLPVLRAGNITDTGLVFDDLVYVPAAKISAKQKIKRGDIVIAASSGSLDVVGKAAPALAAFDGGFGAFCKVIRPNGKVDARYLAQFFKTPSYRRTISSLAAGANINNLKSEHLDDLLLPLPPLPEQRRIAAILDQADALRAKRREAVAQLDSLTQSIFIEMFGEPVSNERGWPTESVADLCALVRGSSPRPQGDPRYFGGPVPRLMVADITRDGWLVTPRIDSLTEEGAKKSRPVPAGTVVMAVSGNVGLVSRLAVDACVHDGFVAFTKLNEKRCDPDYLLALLHLSKAVHEKSKAGAIFINLTTTDIKSMRLPLPDMALQREFLARQAKVAGLTDSMRGSAFQVEALFASLQHRAFNGKL